MKTGLIRTFILALTFGVLTLSAAKNEPKKATQPPADEKTKITRIEPRGIQRGKKSKIKITGVNLTDVKEVKFSNPKLVGTFSADSGSKEAWIEISAAKDLLRGDYELFLLNENGESNKVKIYVDDLPQVVEIATNQINQLNKLPVTFWGALDPMVDRDEIEFSAKAGQTIVFDVAAKSIGSKAAVTISLVDAKGNILAANNGFDGGDPLLAHRFSSSARYRLRIAEEKLGGSPEHFYRLSVGEFPEVIAAFPLSMRTNGAAEVELVGYNLPAQRTVKFKAERAGEMEVPVDLDKFRTRKILKVLVTDAVESIEAEPNDLPGEANRVNVPEVVNGRINAGDSRHAEAMDADLFQFSAEAGQVFVIETDAARRGSPIDTKIEVLHQNGTPVERVLLQAVRDSQINFRPIDANTPDIRVENWTEMELNEFMYLQGEVAKIFRMPQGPDSGFQFYSIGGKRYCYFDTSGIDHALDEPCYIVEPHPPGTKLVPNGLPVFPTFFANDDDGERKLGRDSRVLFTAPADETYLVRVMDSLGQSGERFSYRLSIRKARQDFSVTLNGANPTIAPGSGQEFTFTADRLDGFDGEIEIDIHDLPPGFAASTPVVIQAGHLNASGTIYAAVDAKRAAENIRPKITATSIVSGKKVVKEVNTFGKIQLGESPKLVVALEPYAENETNFVARSISDKPLEITIAPGETVPAWLKVRRTGHDDLVTFTVENLPHGVIVDNIGLNGVLIPKGENERQIFLRAARWVPETDRLAYCQAKQAGNPTSLPVMIHVCKPASGNKISALK